LALGIAIFINDFSNLLNGTFCTYMTKRPTYGDLLVGMPVGWSGGRLNWSVTPSLSIPSGDYNGNALSNVALHRWAGDISAAMTWLDQATGLEASGVAGVTLNGTNPATHYRTGAPCCTDRVAEG
jgi:hypothetical protein